MVTPSTARYLCGAGNGVVSFEGGNCAASWRSLLQPWRAATNPLQCEIASSTGATAREARIAPAMMMPAVASCMITT